MLLLMRLLPTTVPSLFARRGLRAVPSALILKRAPIAIGARDKRTVLWLAACSLIRWALAIARS